MTAARCGPLSSLFLDPPWGEPHTIRQMRALCSRCPLRSACVDRAVKFARAMPLRDLRDARAMWAGSPLGDYRLGHHKAKPARVA